MGQVILKPIGQRAVHMSTAPTKASMIRKGTRKVLIMIGQLLWWCGVCAVPISPATTAACLPLRSNCTGQRGQEASAAPQQLTCGPEARPPTCTCCCAAPALRCVCPTCISCCEARPVLCCRGAAASKRKRGGCAIQYIST